MADGPENRSTEDKRGLFPPGKSGNPGGRPKGYAEFKAACREHTDAAVATLVATLADEKLCVAAAKVLLEYGWGRPPAAPEDREAVQAATSPLAGFTVEQLLALAKKD